ncbi:olfactory receptor 4N2-like [Eublepharis macularius]|uniref:Olfactory receptor n=1 Tax=Eublepharis macularius TaxID=481883 RepID=A0AA97K6M4_EUBMA|nr:olfactory receptor 4N2-like [Eublepharis macularius]
MRRENCTTMVKEFVLLGLSQTREIQLCLFFLFLFIDSLLLPVNILIILTIWSNPRLRSPMFFFLGNLAFLDLCYCAITPPKMLADLYSRQKAISYWGCMAQIFFLHWLGAAEFLLLIGMAFDRYVAICHPLRYGNVVSKGVCWSLIASVWLLGLMHSLIQFIPIIHLPFCGPNRLDNFFCDINQIIKLACTDTYALEFVMFVNSGLATLMCFILLLLSYGALLAKVRSSSTKGKRKTASTCVTHIIIVFIMFAPAIYMYCRPFQDFPLDKIVAIFHTVVFPLMNPMVYTLRNNEIKLAIRKMVTKHKIWGRE